MPVTADSNMLKQDNNTAQSTAIILDAVAVTVCWQEAVEYGKCNCMHAREHFSVHVTSVCNMSNH